MAALWLIVRILLWVLAVLLGLVVLALFVPITAELRAKQALRHGCGCCSCG